MLELLNAVVDFVKAAESVYPESGKGKEKLTHVLDAALAYGPLLGLTVEFVTRIFPLIEAFASRVVRKFNADGSFKPAAKLAEQPGQDQATVIIPPAAPHAI